MADTGPAMARLNDEEAELQAELQGLQELRRCIKDPVERKQRDAARLIAIAIAMDTLRIQIPMSVIEEIRKRDPDGVGRYFDDLACEEDGWEIRDSENGHQMILIPKDAAAALKWPQILPYSGTGTKGPPAGG